MKKIILLIAIFIATGITAQSKYQQNMQKAFSLWQQQKVTEASLLFERIANATPNNWLPAYYVANTEIINAFTIKDETLLDSKLKKAQQFLNVAKSTSKNNPEIIILQALLHTAYIAFDGSKYGMTLAGKVTQLYHKALKIAPNNPRVVLANAEWNIGSAQFFKQPITPFCKDVKHAIKLSKKEKITTLFYPKFQLQRAEAILKKCH